MRPRTVTILFAICALSAPATRAQIVAMTNDDCANPIPVSNGINPGAPAGLSGNVYTNVGATETAGVPLSCIPATNLDVWFSYVATTTGGLSVRTCTPTGFSLQPFDTVVSVLDASTCPPTVQLGCNDDACNQRSNVNVSVTAGTTYYVRVSGFQGATGNFYLVITPQTSPVVNDECSGAIPLACGANGPFSNLFATNSAAPPPSCGTPGNSGFRDLWFSLTTPAGALTINTCNGTGGFNTVLQVFDSCGGVQRACNDNGNNCALGSSVALTATAATTYIIRVSSGSIDGFGSFPINVTLPPNPNPSMTLAWTSPFGAGSLEADLSGPQNGTYFMAVTGVAGAFPNGWLFGLDISYSELASQLSVGFPFTGPMDACGGFTLGPFQGLPSGFTIHSIAFGFFPGAVVPALHSPAVAYTVP
jgi:hypothetical protein